MALGGKKLFEPICLCSDASVAPPRGQQVKQLEVSLRTDLYDVFCLAEAAGGANVHQELERAASHLLCCLYDCLKPFLSSPLHLPEVNNDLLGFLGVEESVSRISRMVKSMAFCCTCRPHMCTPSTLSENCKNKLKK